jgi:hypothetical protein
LRAPIVRSGDQAHYALRAGRIFFMEPFASAMRLWRQFARGETKLPQQAFEIIGLAAAEAAPCAMK